MIKEEDRKISKNTEHLNTLKSTRPNCHCRAYHPRATEYILFSCTHKTFTNIKHILENKTSTNLEEFKSYKIHFLNIIELN